MSTTVSVENKYRELLAIAKKVSALVAEHPEYLHEDADGGGHKWFHAEHPVQDELDTFLCGNFITDKGQYSTLYYILQHRARQHGIRLWTGERDSFGPLVSCMSYDGWAFSFG
jgi:hypothetical protein